MVLPLNDKYVFIDGYMINENVSRVVEAIKSYEPEIDVEWLPPAIRDETQSAFKIVHRPLGGDPYILMFVKHEDDMNMSVLQRIIVNDQRSGADSWNEYTAWEEANKQIEQQKYLDRMEELNDVAAHILKTRQNTYKVNDDLIIKEGIPFNAARLN